MLDLQGDLKNVVAIVGQSALKKDLNIGLGSDFITLSGLGSPKDIVYADPVTVAFHPEAFATQADVENYQKYSAQIMQEFQEAVDTNTMPKKVLRHLEEAADADFSHLPFHMQPSKLRNQEFARQILQLHQSGIGPKDSPLMMNRLHAFFASQAFKTKIKDEVEQFMPALPDVKRFAIGTESVYGLAGERSILGKYSSASGKKGMEDVLFDVAGGTQTNAELMKFRVKNNTILLHAGHVNKYFNSLGGFDLDDKGLPKLMTASYKDENGKTVRDLMFTITRQPSAIQETIYGSAALDDVDTLRHFFGQQDFIETLDRIKGDDDSMNELYRILSTKGRQGIYEGFEESHMKQAILSVYDEMHSMGRATITEADERVKQHIMKFGSSPLAQTMPGINMTDRPGIESVFRATNEALAEAGISVTRNDEIFIRETLQNTLRNDPTLEREIGSSLYKRIINQNLTDKELRQIVSTESANNPALRALLNASVFGKMEELAKEKTDILGVYVNRTMAVGSTLNQMEDFIKAVEGAGGFDDLKILNEFKIGLVTQEFAIDRATTFALQREFLSYQVSALARNDPRVAQQALAALAANLAPGMTVDKLGEEAILNLGRRMGVGTAIFESGKYNLDQSLRPVMDELLLSGRLSESNDIKNMVLGLIEGLEQGPQSQKVKSLLEQLRKHKEGGDEAQKFLLENFGANATHKYASVTKLANEAQRANASFEAYRKLSLAGMRTDKFLAATQVSDDAYRTAQYLLNSHKDELEQVMRMAGDSDTDKAVQTFNKIAMATRVSDDLKRAAQLTGMTQEEIINAMEKVAVQTGFDFAQYEKLVYIDDTRIPMPGTGDISFFQKLSAARTKRISSYYRRTYDPVNLPLIEQAAIAYGEEGAGAKAIAQKMQELSDLGNPQDYFDYVESLTPAELEAFEALKYETTDSSRMIRALSAENALDSNIVKEISAKSSAAMASAPPTDKLATGIKAAIDGVDYAEYVRQNKSPYKRFIDTVKNGEFKQLFSENTTFRRSVYATGALIAGSFIYSAFKDHTPEQIQGPPLLPGGSAYEEQYPNRLAEIPAVGTVNYNPGVSYKVNLYGQRSDVESFRSMAMELGNFNMNTTMYSGIPEVGRDPYAEMASSF